MYMYILSYLTYVVICTKEWDIMMQTYQVMF